MAWLLGICDAASIQTHAARGALFETYVVTEIVKQRLNAGHEVGLLYETPLGVQAIEIKSGSTFASDWPDGILKWQKSNLQAAPPPVIVFAGDEYHKRQSCRVMGWWELHDYPTPAT